MEKELKIKVFEHALVILKSEFDYSPVIRGGLCYSLQAYFYEQFNGTNEWIYVYSELDKPIEESEFPEIVQHRPEKELMCYGNYWFPTDNEGIQKRIDIVERELEKLKKS